jgi:DNA ligase D-like protein (predicted ligase)
MARKRVLPAFVTPMLAQPGQPFDSPDYLFEVKWDGTRALVFIEHGSYRILNRRRFDATDRYPELAFFAGMPEGTILDGEVIVLRDGKPDFGLLQSRDHSRSPLRVRTLAQTTPVTYVAFDLLYFGYDSLLAEPLTERRRRLHDLVRHTNQNALVFSDGIVGQGQAFFDEACRRGLEGVMAKRLDSPYLPGKRTDAWRKIKKCESLICAIVGFVPSGDDDFGALIIAAQEGDSFRCVGKVGTGFDLAMRRRLNKLLWSRLRPRPWLPCKIKGKWVEPGLFCRVQFMERTTGGELRAPSFKELLEATDERR